MNKITKTFASSLIAIGLMSTQVQQAGAIPVEDPGTWGFIQTVNTTLNSITATEMTLSKVATEQTLNKFKSKNESQLKDVIKYVTNIYNYMKVGDKGSLGSKIENKQGSSLIIDIAYGSKSSGELNQFESEVKNWLGSDNTPCVTAKSATDTLAKRSYVACVNERQLMAAALIDAKKYFDNTNTRYDALKAIQDTALNQQNEGGNLQALQYRAAMIQALQQNDQMRYTASMDVYKQRIELYRKEQMELTKAQLTGKASQKNNGTRATAMVAAGVTLATALGVQDLMQ